jgi:hypothetical protein
MRIREKRVENAREETVCDNLTGSESREQQQKPDHGRQQRQVDGQLLRSGGAAGQHRVVDVEVDWRRLGWRGGALLWAWQALGRDLQQVARRRTLGHGLRQVLVRVCSRHVLQSQRKTQKLLYLKGLCKKISTEVELT